MAVCLLSTRKKEGAFEGLMVGDRTKDKPLGKQFPHQMSTNWLQTEALCKSTPEKILVKKI
jgi:hypothetical protein